MVYTRVCRFLCVGRGGRKKRKVESTFLNAKKKRGDAFLCTSDMSPSLDLFILCVWDRGMSVGKGEIECVLALTGTVRYPPYKNTGALSASFTGAVPLVGSQTLRNEAGNGTLALTGTYVPSIQTTKKGSMPGVSPFFPRSLL